jgi:hypothetical protein
MVLPYLKGLIVIKSFVCSSILLCGSIVYSIFLYLYSIQVLNKWYQSTFLGRHCGQIFFIFADFFFRRRKKRAATFQKFLVYFCEKFAETGCISEFLSEKHPS